ncbi:MAG: phosphate signaling complex PhoU family protein [Acidobacteriota bacterium]
MFRELFSIFQGDSPFRAISENTAHMLEIVAAMTIAAGKIFWEEGFDPGDRRDLYRRDVEVNKLQREIRKQVIAHVSVHAPAGLPYALVMMSVVKDVERIGDYAKNLVDMAELVLEELPDDPLVDELQEIRRSVESLVTEAAAAFLESDTDRAHELTREGRRVSKRCDRLVLDVAHSDFTAAAAVKISMGARFYKRIEGHYLNILSSVIMPLHKLDYFDEDYLEDLENEGS